MTGTPEGSTESISGEARNQTCDPWFTRQSAYPLHHGAIMNVGYMLLVFDNLKHLLESLFLFFRRSNLMFLNLKQKSCYALSKPPFVIKGNCHQRQITMKIWEPFNIEEITSVELLMQQ